MTLACFFEEPGFFGENSEGDSYSEPKVMACCDVYDAESPQPHETACYKDLVETLCFSASAKVAVAFDGVVGGDNLAVHVASEEGQEACKLAFNSEIDSWVDSLDPEDPLDLTWAIGNNLVQWPAIDEPFFHLDAQVTDVFIPANSDDYILCEDNDYNNGQSLIGLGDSPEYALMLSEGDGVLVGPTYNTSPMSGNVVFSSDDTSCLAPLCSRLHFSENVSDWTVHNLAFYSSASARVSDNVESVDVDWYHIEMVGAVSAAEKATNKFEIAAGEAIFQLGGNVEGIPHHLTVTNASAITVQKIFGVWRTSSFALQYIDSASSTWTLAIAGAGWEVP